MFLRFIKNLLAFLFASKNIDIPEVYFNEFDFDNSFYNIPNSNVIRFWDKYAIYLLQLPTAKRNLFDLSLQATRRLCQWRPSPPQRRVPGAATLARSQPVGDQQNSQDGQRLSGRDCRLPLRPHPAELQQPDVSQGHGVECLQRAPLSSVCLRSLHGHLWQSWQFEGPHPPLEPQQASVLAAPFPKWSASRRWFGECPENRWFSEYPKIRWFSE